MLVMYPLGLIIKLVSKNRQLIENLLISLIYSPPGSNMEHEIRVPVH